MKRRRKISESIRRQVAERAGYRCSYCRSPEWAGVPMVVDHIIPLAAGGTSEIENLCLACYRCNEFKGARVEAIDPLTGGTVAIFRPHFQVWPEYFAWSQNNLYMVGLTACGRATIEMLHLNDNRLIQARQIWLLVGLHPPLE
jgi:HNH endonuclease